MILGEPAKFAIVFDVVKEWNTDSSFNNGVLMISVDWKVYPGNEIVNATLNFEIPNLKDCMSNIGVDEQLFELPKDEAFTKMYDLRFPEDWDVDEDYRFDISPEIISDNDCLIFAVSNGMQVRVLAATNLEYIKTESRFNLKNIEISETYISIEEWNEILSKLDI